MSASSTLPEELVELIFDKILERYLPDVDTKDSLQTYAGHTLMVTSQVDFSRIPNLEEVKFDFYPQEYITEASLGKIRNFLLGDLLNVFGIPQHNGDPVSVKTLDLGRISLLLVPNSPALSPRTDYARDMDHYPKELARTPFIAFDMSLWGILDAAQFVVTIIIQTA